MGSCSGVIMFLVVCLLQTSVLFASRKPYIIYLGSHAHGPNPVEAEAVRATQSHYKLLGSVLGSKETAQEAIFYSYNTYINGFAAVLTEEEAERIKKFPNVVSVFEDYGLTLHTTRSWEFMGLEYNGLATSDSLWNKSEYGRDVIIGNLDTGVWPESPSFNEEGLGPIPSRWKGACVDESPNKIKCNTKLIGARYFKKGFEMLTHQKLNSSYESARDHDGHGTHTLSTAGGSFVADANIIGYDYGTVKGGSPKARVAAYKIFWPPIANGVSCSSADLMAAFEAAISDRVDVLSMSLGGYPYEEYKEDVLAVGAFHAVQHGITVVASAGNAGPDGSTVGNNAPWFLTVGASTLDRDFTNWVSFGFKHIKGRNDAGSQQLPEKQLYPVINSISAMSHSATAEAAAHCEPESLDPSIVKGKIIVCQSGGKNPAVEKSLVVLEAGGVGYILANEPENKITDIPGLADIDFLPASHITSKDSRILLAYLNNSKDPHAYITGTKTLTGSKRAPVVASFSSIGPNPNDPEILKPDIIAPGVSIIAAFSEAVGPSELSNDTRRVKFNIMSGTSMSCPHISGIVGLLKALHPDWSPAAVKSAIMTTAITTDNAKKPISKSSTSEIATPLDYGAGHVRPNDAADPGLVYDLTVDDYLNFLCAKGYSETDIINMAQKPYKCSPTSLLLVNTNYPAIVIPKLKGSANVTREVKNVGTSGGNYNVTVTAPAGVSVRVEPVSLKFNKPGDVNKFTVTFKVVGYLSTKGYVFGSLVWSDGAHKVRSPIAVMAAA